MSDITPHRLSEMVIAALERTAFVLADEVESDRVSSLPAPTHAAVIRYSGPQQGSVRLEASDGFLREVASSLLGVEPDQVDIDREGLDVIRELANIVGGSVILELGGESCPFALGLPEEVPVDAGQSAAACVCDVESEGERLRIVWAPEPAAAAA